MPTLEMFWLMNILILLLVYAVFITVLKAVIIKDYYRIISGNAFLAFPRKP